MKTRACIGAALMILVVACRDEASVAADMTTSNPATANFKDVPAEGIALGAQASRQSLGRPAPAPPAVVVTGVASAREEQAQTSIAAVTSGMVIRNGAVNIQVDSIEPAVERIRGIAIAHGGYVGGLTVQAGEHQVRSATLELKVPSARFDSVMTGMPTLGKVEHSSTSAEDVGEEYVDLTARAQNAKRLEARLVSLLATRTGKLDDVLMVERELARVREEIERHEGRLRYLTTRVAMSTIHATVHEKMPVIAAAPGRNVLVEAFKNMWRNFVRILVLGIEMLGVAIPVLLVASASYWMFRRWRQRRLLPTS